MNKFIENSLILFDTEYTAWEGSMERKWSNENEYKEIVQIAAIKVINKEIVDKFNVLITPKINQQLSDYFINLTGITQKDLDKSIDFEIAVQNFMDFCGDLNVYSYGYDYDIILENFKLYKIPINKYFDWRLKYFDIRDYFRQFNINVDNYSSGTIYKISNKIHEDASVHNALWDVKSILIAIKYIENKNIAL